MHTQPFSVVQPHLRRHVVSATPHFEGGVIKEVNKPAPPFKETRPNWRLINYFGQFNQWMSRRLKLVAFDLPPHEEQILRNTINPKTAAFISASHPEYFTDMIVDKQLARQYFPEVLMWAHAGFVNISKVTHDFFLKNNAIPHTAGEAGKNYSIDWALKGKGVLLHPEGNVRWTSDKVHKIFSGIAEMPIEAAKRSLVGDKRPVYIVPIVWKYHYPQNITKGLHKNMTFIEKRFDLPRNPKLSISDRYAEIHKNFLRKQQERFHLPADRRYQTMITNKNYFERKQQFIDFLMDELISQFGSPNGDIYRRLRHIQQAVSEMDKADEKKKVHYEDMVETIQVLLQYSPDVYGKSPVLSQEQIFESLKRMERFLLPGSLGTDGLRKNIPVPAGPRVVRVRVAEPIDVTKLVRENTLPEAQLESQLVGMVHQRMQSRIDKLSHEIEHEVRPFSHPNPFYTTSVQA